MSQQETLLNWILVMVALAGLFITAFIGIFCLIWYQTGSFRKALEVLDKGYTT